MVVFGEQFSEKRNSLLKNIYMDQKNRITMMIWGTYLTIES